MKYIILCITALAVCAVCAVLPAMYIKRRKNLSDGITCLISVGFAAVLICAVMFGYLSQYYHADTAVLFSSDNVHVEKIDGGYFFDGPGDKDALIFYPGAKVEALSYSNLMMVLAENDVDCFLVDMPFRMAIFASNAGNMFMQSYNYSSWTAAGHSMGGLVISGFAQKHEDKIDDLILLAAYPGSNIPDSINFCSIYGSNDGCLNMEAYENSKEYWPIMSSEFVIEGGNHAQYADYGEQSGDNKADISSADQQKKTAEIILNIIHG